MKDSDLKAKCKEGSTLFYRSGCPISIVWESIERENTKEVIDSFILIRDVEGNIICYFTKYIWDAFSPEIRDSILNTVRSHY